VLPYIFSPTRGGKKKKSALLEGPAERKGREKKRSDLYSFLLPTLPTICSRKNEREKKGKGRAVGVDLTTPEQKKRKRETASKRNSISLHRKRKKRRFGTGKLGLLSSPPTRRGRGRGFTISGGGCKPRGKRTSPCSWREGGRKEERPSSDIRVRGGEEGRISLLDSASLGHRGGGGETGRRQPKIGNKKKANRIDSSLNFFTNAMGGKGGVRYL